MIRQKNPEHDFHIPYLQPIKAKVEQDNMPVDLVDFILPKEATILIDQNGVEGIYVDGKPVQVFTELTGLVYLINNDEYIQIKQTQPDEKKGILYFPGVNRQVG